MSRGCGTGILPVFHGRDVSDCPPTSHYNRAVARNLENNPKKGQLSTRFLGFTLAFADTTRYIDTTK
jgi:hypothetical protein